MTTMDYTAVPAAVPARRTRPFRVLRAWYRRLQLRRRQRLTIMALSDLDPRLLRDIGLNPRDVRAAMESRQPSLLFEPVRMDDGY